MHIIATVTNDLTYDQRMQRICRSLVRAGYAVTLVGRQLPQSQPIDNQIFNQKRLSCYFKKGFSFYAEYNLRLFFYLLFARYDAVCTVDLDTLPAGCLATLLRQKRRVFDAHEYFTEVPEVTNRPIVKAIWATIARLFLPFYRHAYTVGPALAQRFTQQHRIPFGIVRNLPAPQAASDGKTTSDHEVASDTSTSQNQTIPPSGQKIAIKPPSLQTASDHEVASDTSTSQNQTIPPSGQKTEIKSPSPQTVSDSGVASDTPTSQNQTIPPSGQKIAIKSPSLGEGLGVGYQGALNTGRGIATILQAMPLLPTDIHLWLAGEGDLSTELRQMAVDLHLTDRVHFMGYVQPEALKTWTNGLWLGLNLLENKGLSYYYSLANKFFDYVQARVPVITMNFPEYAALNKQHEVAILLTELTPEAVATAILQLYHNPVQYKQLQQHCDAAAAEWTWAADEQNLLKIWAAAMA